MALAHAAANSQPRRLRVFSLPPPLTPSSLPGAAVSVAALLAWCVVIGARRRRVLARIAGCCCWWYRWCSGVGDLRAHAGGSRRAERCSRVREAAALEAATTMWWMMMGGEHSRDAGPRCGVSQTGKGGSGAGGRPRSLNPVLRRKSHPRFCVKVWTARNGDFETLYMSPKGTKASLRDTTVVFGGGPWKGSSATAESARAKIFELRGRPLTPLPLLPAWLRHTLYQGVK
ncbi:hypothetical protein BD410DRAFT_874055 [Rickenella mellea]|uniref:Uncharacterized protein n=1 Tax=Rickenella mellea TaxID=50990 RepID=A0A4Y7PWF0_9AGAM|nr:hypothetical protein BD410DRAFT_874055 [Rickenella mellea]